MPALFPRQRLLPLLAGGALQASWCRGAQEEGTCAAGDPTCDPTGAAARSSRAQEYYWPQQKGDVNRTGLSPYTVPFDISGGPKWVWKDPNFDVVRFTPLIDDRRNIYFGTVAGRIYKFSPDGELLWKHEAGVTLPAVPAMLDGGLFYNRKDGSVVALDMETAQVRWEVKISNGTGGDTACVYAVDGLVVSATEIGPMQIQGMGSNNGVVALHASNGSQVWVYRLTWPVYNWQASSPGDGTMVFQDRAGGVYRLSLTNGSLLWESGVRDRAAGDFTTGAAVVGPNGMVYAASNYRGAGIIHAYQLSDGALVWRQDLGMPVNQAVAVARLAGSERLSVVAGVGDNPLFPAAFFLIAVFGLLNLVLACCCSIRCCFRACCGTALNCRRHLLSVPVVLFLEVLAVFAIHHLSLAWEAKPGWLFFVRNLPAAMTALDAETGTVRWSYTPPAFKKPSCEGDEAMLGPRIWRTGVLKEPGDPICLPDNWAQTIVDAGGTTFGGHQDGYLYAVRDADGSGTIDPDKEVSRYYLGAAFQASQAIAPGLLAVAPCGGGLFVWAW